ncbi:MULTISPECIES: hypothetical protein, partial [Sphingobacterium]
EVKPARADGIAVTGGRVGRCLFLYRSLCYTAEAFLCLYLFYQDYLIFKNNFDQYVTTYFL